jgi:hypothetical protein
VSIFEFDIKGTSGLMADATVPARTFSAHTVVPPKNEDINLTIDGVVGLKVRTYTYTHGYDVSPRIDINALSGHAGFAGGRRKPEFKVTVEAEALSTFNPYNLMVSGTSVACSFGVGSVATNKFTVSMSQAQVTNVTRNADGPLAVWDLTITPWTSAPDSSDDISIAFL